MSYDTETTAYHEAGHAVMAVLVGETVQAMTIEPDNDDGPRREGDVTIALRASSGKSSAENELLARKAWQIALAGPAAEMHHTGDPFHPALVQQWSEDWAHAWSMAAQRHRDEQERLRFLELETRRIYQLFGRDEIWQAIASLADELQAHETLESDQIHEIVTRWI